MGTGEKEVEELPVLFVIRGIHIAGSRTIAAERPEAPPFELYICRALPLVIRAICFSPGAFPLMITGVYASAAPEVISGSGSGVVAAEATSVAVVAGSAVAVSGISGNSLICGSFAAVRLSLNFRLPWA